MTSSVTEKEKRKETKSKQDGFESKGAEISIKVIVNLSKMMGGLLPSQSINVENNFQNTHVQSWHIYSRTQIPSLLLIATKKGRMKWEREKVKAAAY